MHTCLFKYLKGVSTASKENSDGCSQHEPRILMTFSVFVINSNPKNGIRLKNRSDISQISHFLVEFENVLKILKNRDK